MTHHDLSKGIKAFSLCVLIAFTSCKTDEKKEDISMTSDNILLQEWTGPFEGVPAFDKMNVADVKEAMELAMEANLAEIEDIANNEDEPTFENTIIAMESSGKALNRVYEYYGILSSNMSSPEFRKIQSELALNFLSLIQKSLKTKNYLIV